MPHARVCVLVRKLHALGRAQVAAEHEELTEQVSDEVAAAVSKAQATYEAKAYDAEAAKGLFSAQAGAARSLLHQKVECMLVCPTLHTHYPTYVSACRSDIYRWTLARRHGRN